jgi:hypothetical protein
MFLSLARADARKHDALRRPGRARRHQDGETPFVADRGQID